MPAEKNIQCFMHVPFEGPGVIARWAEERGHSLNYTRFYEQDPLPDPSSADLLLIMGGPMNVFDYHMHPWMEEEMEWISSFIKNTDKPVLGICLGAQMIASALGADVYPGPHKEIGWFSLQCLPALGEFRICPGLPSSRKVFHWHGDTFDIPKGAVRIAKSKAFPNQGFIFDSRVIALQFHLEVDMEAVAGMIQHCGDELTDGPYMQNAGEILADESHFADNQELIFQFMEYLLAQAQSK